MKRMRCSLCGHKQAKGQVASCRKCGGPLVPDRSQSTYTKLLGQEKLDEFTSRRKKRKKGS